MNSKICDENYFDLIIDNAIVGLYENNDTNHIFPINPKSSLLLVDSSQFQMYSLGAYPYASFPSLFTLNSDVCINSNIEKIQSNPNFALYGQGVLVGVIDSGIDYLHPAFRHPDGTTRILSLWDQTLNTNFKTPQDFFYGAEFNHEMLNRALLNENPLSLVPSVDEVGHGTMISGIIGGKENAEHHFSGIVPMCEFLVVKLKPAKKINKRVFCVPEEQLCYEENDIITALTYITEKARQFRRPLALCIALGTSQGGHNGKGATSGYLDYITQSPHTAVAVAAGNEGNRRRHFYGRIMFPAFTDVELNVDYKDPYFSMEIWGDPPYRLAIDITTPNGETIQHLYPRINECRRLSFVFNSSVVWLNNVASESDTGDQLILIRFENATSGIWRFRVYGIDNENTAFHAWLPANDLISPDTYFLNSDSYCTLTSPGNASSPLVVANYNEALGAVSLDSSRGYTRYNVLKPDLASPGCNLPAPLPGNRYGSLLGTGASAAHAAGIMAMVLEWAVVQGRHSSITGSDINRMLVRGAFRDKLTEYPNPTSGYGLIDIYGLFEKLS